MSFFRRASRVISANINDLLDRIEQPEQMLRQGLRELASSIATVSAAVARSIAAERLLARERDDYRSQSETWAARAKAACNSGNDELARKAIARKLESARLVAELDDQLADAHTANESLRRQLETLRNKHASAKRRLSTVEAKRTVVAARQQAGIGVATVSRGALALDGVDRLLDQMDWIEAEATARAELAGQGDEVSRHFELAAQSDQIEAELRKLRETR